MKRWKGPSLAAVLCGLLTGEPPAVQAQANHVHYEKSPAIDAPAASGALAPRLQNLGSYDSAAPGSRRIGDWME